jgi:uncharacterized membrane protein
MGQALGIITAAVQLGIEAIRVTPTRSMGGFTAQVVLREVHTDELEITDQPVEQGARITDHAYKRPQEVCIECGWSNSPQNIGLMSGLIGAATGTIGGIASILTGNSLDQIRDIYAKLVALQDSREPFDVQTGKREYKNMLIKSLVTTTDKETENSLFVTAILREVIIVKTQVLTIGADQEDQAEPEDTMPPVDEGEKQPNSALNYNHGAAERAGIDASDAPVSSGSAFA